MYACTLRIARKRIDERLAIEKVSGVRRKNGASWGRLGHCLCCRARSVEVGCCIGQASGDSARHPPAPLVDRDRWGITGGPPIEKRGLHISMGKDAGRCAARWQVVP